MISTKFNKQLLDTLNGCFKLSSSSLNKVYLPYRIFESEVHLLAEIQVHVMVLPVND